MGKNKRGKGRGGFGKVEVTDLAGAARERELKAA